MPAVRAVAVEAIIKASKGVQPESLRVWMLRLAHRWRADKVPRPAEDLDGCDVLFRADPPCVTIVAPTYEAADRIFRWVRDVMPP
jgi:hypothetical protein